MTKQELDTLRALADAATPGPWICLPDGDILGLRYDPDWNPETDTYPDHMDNVLDIPLVDLNNVEDVDLKQAHTNREFCAAAREAVPALIARVEELEAERNAALARAEAALARVARLEEAHAEALKHLGNFVDATTMWADGVSGWSTELRASLEWVTPHLPKFRAAMEEKPE